MQQHRSLLDERHPTTEGGSGTPRDNRAVPEHGSFRRTLEEGQQPEQRALARAIVADHRDRRGLRQRELVEIEHHASRIAVPHRA